MGFIVSLILGGMIAVGAVLLSNAKGTSNDGGATAYDDNQNGQPWFSGGHGDSGKCNGDCDNCPAHYGYRYGRWYYGHGHQHGCERGGNGGASGRTYRD